MILGIGPYPAITNSGVDGLEKIPLMEQINCGWQRYGVIIDIERLRANFVENCFPDYLLNGKVAKHDESLADRHLLMALNIKAWFEALS